MCARTLWPLVNSTRNIALGRASTTEPSISMTPSFLAIPSLIAHVVALVVRVAISGGVGIVGAAARRKRAQSTKDRAYGIRNVLAKSGVGFRSAVRELGFGGFRVADAALGQPGEDPRGDLVDLAESVDLEQHAAVAVHCHYRLRLALVDLLAVPDGLLGVIGAALLESALAKPAHDLFAVGEKPDDGIQRLAVGGEQRIEVLHLVGRAGVAVEQEPVCGIR